MARPNRPALTRRRRPRRPRWTSPTATAWPRCRCGPWPDTWASRRCRSTTTSPTRTPCSTGWSTWSSGRSTSPGSAPTGPAELRLRHESAREVLTRHRWAVGLMDSRSAPGLMTLRHHDAVLGCLRAGGFSVPMAAHAFALLDAHLYGFLVQELALPFAPGDDLDAMTTEMMADFPVDALPHLAELATQHVTQPRLCVRRRVRLGPRADPRRPRAASVRLRPPDQPRERSIRRTSSARSAKRLAHHRSGCLGRAVSARARNASSMPNSGNSRPVNDHRRGSSRRGAGRAAARGSARRTAPAARPGRAARTRSPTCADGADRHRAVDGQLPARPPPSSSASGAAARTPSARTQASGSGSRSSSARDLAVGLAAQLGLADQRPPLQVDVVAGLRPAASATSSRSPAVRASAAQRDLAAAGSLGQVAGRSSATAAVERGALGVGRPQLGDVAGQREVRLDHRRRRSRARSTPVTQRTASAAVASPVTSMSQTVATATPREIGGRQRPAPREQRVPRARRRAGWWRR